MDAYTVINKFCKKIQKAQILDLKYQRLEDIELNKKERLRLKNNVIEIFNQCLDYIQFTFKKGRTDEQLISFIAYFADMVGDGYIKCKLKENKTKLHKIYKLNTNKGNFEIHMIKEKAPYKPLEDGKWLINPISIVKI